MEMDGWSMRELELELANVFLNPCICYIKSNEIYSHCKQWAKYY